MISLWYGLAVIASQNGKESLKSWGKFMAELKFYNQLDPRTKNKKKSRHESKKSRLKKSRSNLEWL